jgi:hypothetical protein
MTTQCLSPDVLTEGSGNKCELCCGASIVYDTTILFTLFFTHIDVPGTGVYHMHLWDNTGLMSDGMEGWWERREDGKNS